MADRPDGYDPTFDIFNTLEESGRIDLFTHIDLDISLKDDLYELIGDAIKEGMRLRERYPVRLTSPSWHDSDDTFVRAYLAEVGGLIQTYFDRVAGRVSAFVNEDIL